VWGTLGCESSRSADPTGPAGTVEAIEGEVTAARANASRRLAKGESVWGDDVVTTAAGASIGIRLTHNGVLWALEGGQTRRVDDSVAWRAPRESGAGLGTAEKDRTAAAGRHAEQEAGETGATAAAREAETARADEEKKQAAESDDRRLEAERRAEEERRQVEAERARAEAAARESERRERAPAAAAKEKKIRLGGGDPNDPLGGLGNLEGSSGGASDGVGGLAVRGGGGGGGGGGGSTGGIGTLGKGGGTGSGSGYGSGGGKAAVPKGALEILATTVEGDESAVDLRVLKMAKSRLQQCVDRQLAANPNLTGLARFELVISDEGKVSALSPGVTSGLEPDTVACLTTRLRALQFPAQPLHKLSVVLRFKTE
jgi:hypothetical protein